MGKLKKDQEDIKNKTLDELKILYKDLMERYRVLRFDKVLGGLSDLSLLCSIRKEIARVCTRVKELNR